ncbi:hypothetical protein I8J29_04860 [Paenibacillus sp. MWE-103]|uniref:Phytanoyl-CoA dioxygenase PhyH n=1 Tax=Paenibacillus artemisiicola TaxID=1172618 RepID=A0ABS3W5E0_9BACL|nr:hypothetical protein [Paenibacillus artemisiicola]MBO7743513.1 hypothetical protein [Paenibacillus artemisiicola]
MQHERNLRLHGPEVLVTEEKFAKEYQSSGIDYGEPVQVKGNPGDLIVANYMLLHSAAYNRSPNIRYSCYFRVDHVDRASDWKAPLTDAWLHFPGLRA